VTGTRSVSELRSDRAGAGDMYLARCKINVRFRSGGFNRGSYPPT
jgi:hypothetical protein